MNRQLPIVVIEGTAFYVDVPGDQLRQKDNPANCIPFSVFDQEGDGYTFLYDLQVKNSPPDRSTLKKMEPHLKWVTLPALMELDPEGIALKYDIPLDILCPEKAGKISIRQLLDEEEEDDYEIYG